MLYRDPKCVFVANNVGQADIVAGWLEEHGFPAEVMTREMMGGLGPALTAMTGIEVWIVDPAQAPEAIRVLGEHAVELVIKTQTGSPLEVVCEECGKTSTFPPQQRGSVQNCPHCSAYIDVEAAEAVEQSQEPSEDEGPGTDAITEKGPGDIKRP